MTLRSLLVRSLPPGARRGLRGALARLRYWGWRRFCPVCRANLRTFLADPATGRAEATCPVCGARERHRAIWPFLMQETMLARAELRVLHVAPEPCFAARLARLPLLDYVTLDLVRDDVSHRGDLTKLVFEDDAFEFIICNHVLEHIADDGAAMREMFRVLAPGGMAVVTVPGPDPARGFPTDLARTVEDPEVGTADERLRRYGHPDHVRQYGRDVAERLRSAGFAVQSIEYGAGFPPLEKVRRGLYESYPIQLCWKPRTG